MWIISSTHNLENILSFNDRDWITLYINVIVYTHCNQIVCVCVCVLARARAGAQIFTNLREAFRQILFTL